MSLVVRVMTPLLPPLPIAMQLVPFQMLSSNTILALCTSCSNIIAGTFLTFFFILPIACSNLTSLVRPLQFTEITFRVSEIGPGLASTPSLMSKVMISCLLKDLVKKILPDLTLSGSLRSEKCLKTLDEELYLILSCQNIFFVVVSRLMLFLDNNKK